MIAAAVGCVGVAGGALALRRAWRTRDAARPAWIVGGWALIALAIAGWTLDARLDKAVAVASLALALAAYGLVAATTERRGPARRKLREEPNVEPQPRPRRFARAALRLLAAAMLSAAFGIGAGLVLSRLPGMGDVDALVLGGLTAPVAWTAAMVWAVADPRPGRPAVGLAILSIILIGIGAWPR